MNAQLISEEYREMNRQLHSDRDTFGAYGNKFAPLIVEFCKGLQSRDVLDYGCGKGALAKSLPFPIRMYDPAVPEHSAMPAPADFVVCTDVLEHIEPESLDAVLDHLQSLVRQLGFFVISNQLAKKTLSDGRNAHLIVQPARWWLEKLWDRFDIQEMKCMMGETFVVVRPRGSLVGATSTELKPM